MTETTEDKGTSLMKIVEAIAISPDDARGVAKRYFDQAQSAYPSASEEKITTLVADKIIARYSKMAALSGGTTSLAGVIPGMGTAVSVVGGGLADVSVCMKLQIDMTMCLAMAINGELSNEDAKHLSFVIALSGSLEQMASRSATKAASKASAKVVSLYLKGATLETVKLLFKQVGITFTKTSLIKAIPFGVGVIIGSSANYALTRFVGAVARDVLQLHKCDDVSKAPIDAA